MNNISIDDLQKQEFTLAKKLRDLCNEEGKETDPVESAHVLHSFGLLYKDKSPDKICLIQSAAFFNAAIVRQPFNLKFQDDLKELCYHILKLARANKLTSNLVAISLKVAVKVKEMRVYTNHALQSLENIPVGLPGDILKEKEKEKVLHIQTLQIKIAESYTQIMNYISDECIDIMGQPPCQYSVAGLGSLARKEITPFSDFEHVIILEEGVQHAKNYQEILEYFRFFSVIFQVIVINLKETIVRSVAVPLLNDDSFPGGDWFFDNHTPCGIKFDGMQLQASKIPLGRTRETIKKPFKIELVKPVSKMVKYLEKEEDLKNGYHLADMLTKTCFVSGHQEVYDEFQEEVKKTMNNKDSFGNKVLADQLEENLETFSAYGNITNLKLTTFFNLKSVMYRSSTIFISTLGRRHAMESNSCFGIIDEMLQRNLISPRTAHMLAYAVSISCECRLKVYMSTKGQNDFVGGKGILTSRKTILDLVEYIGEESVADYFTIAYCLQEAVKSGIADELKELGCSIAVRFAILWNLHLFQVIVNEWKLYLQMNEPEPVEEDLKIRFAVCDMYTRNKDYEKGLELSEFFEKLAINDPELKATTLSPKAICLTELGKFESAMTYIEHAITVSKGLKLKSRKRSIVLGGMFTYLGFCKERLKLYELAVSSYLEAVHHMKYSAYPSQKREIGRVYLAVGRCYYELESYEKSILSLNPALIVCRFSNIDVVVMFEVYHLLGLCYFKQGKFFIALHYHQEELSLMLKHIPKEEQETNEAVKKCKTLIECISGMLPQTHD